MDSCWICAAIFGPERVHGADVLRTFEGYTVDLRLKQFRKAPLEGALELVDFDSPLGTKLCDRMHDAALEELGKIAQEILVSPRNNAG